MPAATWHFLKMNDATIDVPEGLTIAPSVQASGSWATVPNAHAFDQALARAQGEWEKTHPAPTAEERAEREAYLAAEADATYGGTAQSSYQANADAIEQSRSLAAAFEHGTGSQAAAFLRDAAGERMVIQASPGEVANAQMLVNAMPGTVSATAIDVIAERDSTVNLTLVVNGASTQGGLGLTGTTVRVFADADAHVNIVRTQTLDAGFTDIDDMGLFANDRAHITVRQTVLGATTTFTGLAGDLRGDSAQADVETRYLGHGSQSHDFNYILRHHGTRTQCRLHANGVLADSSSKTLRGTIDLIRGCKGAEGLENETVLLVDENVKNKTVPVILCNEDDVAGSHGASIGHIRDEQLFYLASRGLSQKDAEAMFVGAVVEQAAIDAPDQASRAGVLRFGDSILPGFSVLFDEEGEDD